jgi:propionyl-CoA carboxylase beta chain
MNDRAARAAETIRALLDPGSIDPWIGKKGVRVQCARGTVSARPIAVYAVEAGHYAGVIGPREAEEIIEVGEFARSMQMPLVSVNAALSPLVSAGLDGVNACARIARQSARLSQLVPQIAMVTDPSVLAHDHLSTFADLIVMTGDRSALRDAAHCVEPDLAAAIARVRRLISLLPRTSAELRDALTFSADGGDRELSPALCEKLRSPAPFDVFDLIREVCDRESFVELDAHRGPGIATGLARIFDQPVGICANQTLSACGGDRAALDKTVELANLCDRFSIPLLNIVDAGEEATERVPALGEDGSGPPARAVALRQGAALMRARQMMGPCVSLVVRRCYGTGYLLTAAARPHHAVIAYRHAALAPEGVDGSVEEAYARGWIKKVVDPKDTVAELVHWVRWSRSERARVTNRLHPNDPLLYNLDLDGS